MILIKFSITFLRIYLNIFKSSFPVIYHAKHKAILGLQGVSEYHVNRNEVCIFSAEIGIENILQKLGYCFG
jgi:hypothetical protein